MIRFQYLTENAKIASKAIIISEFSNKYNRPLTRLTRAQKTHFFQTAISQNRVAEIPKLGDILKIFGRT